MKRSMKRCKMRKGNGMLLREYLKEWTKEDLLNEARSYELKNCSRLKKDDLVDRIVEYLTTEGVRNINIRKVRTSGKCLCINTLYILRDRDLFQSGAS